MIGGMHQLPGSKPYVTPYPGHGLCGTLPAPRTQGVWKKALLFSQTWRDWLALAPNQLLQAYCAGSEAHFGCPLPTFVSQPQGHGVPA